MFSLVAISKVIHLLGLALGAGAAFITDIYFFRRIIKPGKLTPPSFQTISLLSKIVWLGLTTSIVSGIGLFWSAKDFYLSQPWFMAKMSIVFIIAANGTYFHFVHLKRLKNLIGQPLSKISAIKFARGALLISGAYSSISWTAVIILGSLASINSASLSLILSIYLTIIILASSTLLLFKRHLIPNETKKL